ncbi:MAG: substrate-binding domain-containing protein [Gemmatimonadaceae bacterium]|nr:substrate-binding domain-containing protein [Gemmatimonadaceae bacterium]MCW5826373.1 substrate-binding domain-containing protein [Gemmatimonadaceae bacterium]
MIAISACQGGDSAQETLTVFNAGSLARPLKAALDTFARRENVRVHQESAGSLESARKLTELGKVPDLIALADAAVFPQYLVPRYVTSYTLFARNRMVVAFTDRSRHAREIGTANWPEILTRADVDVGRSDPDLDPNGYRTLMVWQLIARTRGDDALAARLEAQAVPRNVRAKEADLVGLLQAGELDYIWSYESMAKATGLRWVMLGDSVDLSQPALADFYGQARVALRGAREGEHVVFTGQPIVYALAVPAEAPNRALGERFEAFLLGAEGRAILRREGLDVLEMPQVEHGTASAGLLAGRAARR